MADFMRAGFGRYLLGTVGMTNPISNKELDSWEESMRCDGNGIHIARSVIRSLIARIRLAENETESAYHYAVNSILIPFVTEHCNPDPSFMPLPNLIGVLTQIDNATTVVRDLRKEKAEQDDRFEIGKGALRCIACGDTDAKTARAMAQAGLDIMEHGVETCQKMRGDAEPLHNPADAEVIKKDNSHG